MPDLILKAFKKVPGIDGLPMAQEKQITKEWKEDLSKAIVPLQPVLGCLLFKAWATQMEKFAARPIQIPTIVSQRPGAKTPLVDTLVRRSTRLNPDAVGGVKVVQIKEPASKRRKKVGQLVDLNQPPTTASEAANPIPLGVIQEWGRSCGVSPMELSEDALMTGQDDEEV